MHPLPHELLVFQSFPASHKSDDQSVIPTLNANYILSPTHFATVHSFSDCSNLLHRQPHISIVYDYENPISDFHLHLIPEYGCHVSPDSFYPVTNPDTFHLSQYFLPHPGQTPSLWSPYSPKYDFS